MTKCLITVVILIFFANYLQAQTFSISAAKQIYNLDDTIQIELINLKSVDHYIAIGIELKYDNKWGELEPTINQEGKVEVFKKAKDFQEKIIKVILPKYLKNLIQNDGRFYIRFRLKEGQSLDNLDLSYSPPILITIRNN